MEAFFDSPRAPALLALVPAMIATAIFVFGLVAFSIRCWLFGVPKDAETLDRGASVLVGFFLRHYFFWLARPAFRWMSRSGVPAAALTVLSAILGLSSGIAVASGRFALGGWLFLVAGMLDALDGRLARVSKTASPAGEALDSILDRYTDSFLLIGLGWYYRDSWVLLPVLLSFLGSSLVPYVRARGEALGVRIRSGLMQRVERVVVLGGSIALSPIVEAFVAPQDPHPQHWLAIAGITITAVTSNTTAISRFLSLMRALGGRVAKGGMISPERVR